MKNVWTILLLGLCGYCYASPAANLTGGSGARKISWTAIGLDAQPVDTTVALEVGTYSNFSMQLTYSDAVVATASVLDAEISVANNTMNEATHGFSTGLDVLYTLTAGTAPTGLTSGTTYYAIRDSANYFKLALTSTGAVAGAAIDITGVAGGSTHSFAPLAFVTGSMGWKWQGSNDGTNYSDLAISPVVYSSDATDIYDFNGYNYRYLRLNITGPTRGGVDIDGILYGLVE
jgi:hypothetical protein